MAYRVAPHRVWTIWPLTPLLCALFVYMTGFSSTLPALVDVILGAICPGQDECSEVIFLAGLQTTMIGIGTMVVAPFLGGLSDDYGRKPVFLLVVISSTAPSLVLAYSREKVYVYVWWVLNLFGSVLREAGLLTITFAFVADVVPDSRQRASGIGIAMSSISIGLLGGTLLGRVLSTVHVFKMSAVLQIASAALVKVFLIESHPKHFTRLPASVQEDETEKLVPFIPRLKGKNILKETLETVRSSKMLRTVAGVAFMVNITETTLSTTLLYYLKAVFGFGKDEFAQFMVVIGVVAIISQMVAYPVLAHTIGERGVLWVGLLGAAINMYLYAFAWADWVPYFACAFGIFYALVPAAIGTIVSRGAEPEQQGKVQGLIASVKTVATVIGPIALTPLTAAFLSEHPPFKFPGFSLMIGGTAMIVALLMSLTLPRLSSPEACFETVTPPTSDQCTMNNSEDVEVERQKGKHELVEP